MISTKEHMVQRKIIPIYTTRGDAEAFLSFPYLYNRLGEWIGWVTSNREVYSVLGYFVGEISLEPRILRRRITQGLKSRQKPPNAPPRLIVPATIPLAPLMGELIFGIMDVLLEEPERLHTLDSGELHEDID
jgi:hypothetical protein